MLKIVTYPHPALLNKCHEIETFDDDLKGLIEKMFIAMKHYNGIGLAANQLGISKNLFVMEIDTIKYTFINPKIIKLSDDKNSYNEGCLSFPNLKQDIIRPNTVTLEWKDIDNNHHIKDFNGLHATCIQHEIDHLNGITFLDNLSQIKKLFAFKKYLKNKNK